MTNPKKFTQMCFLIMICTALVFASGCIESSDKKAGDVKQFSSEAEFKEYLQAGSESASYNGGYGTRGSVMMEDASVNSVGTAPTSKGMSQESPERVSETNVQVMGIDEPDIVKTDGKEIFFSDEYYPVYRSVKISADYYSPYSGGNTKVINAFPPETLNQTASINKSGNLLLDRGTLIIFQGNEIFGFDVSNPKAPEQRWNIRLNESSSLIDARLYQGKIYFTLKNWINTNNPCPIIPLAVNEKDIIVECTGIYHPVEPSSSDSLFTSLKVDAKSGEVEDEVSFVGSSSSSIMYMSTNAIYLTYPKQGDTFKFLLDLFKENSPDLIPEWVVQRMEKIINYDISQTSKMMEFTTILSQFEYSLSKDDRLKFENEFSDKSAEYFKNHVRDFEKTGIVKIDLDNLNIEANGEVPGNLLNQWALDEYEGNLRVATTVGERNSFINIGSSANDVYILDSNLDVLGSIKGLGLTEKIYSVRFIEDKGYLVTFRQTDPFYILDLSSPTSPEMKGELKIPGYSSYLHPISSSEIIGIGKEDWKVKISLFDVSSSSEPKEADKYILDEYWSEVISNHRAFLIDYQNKIFFLPGNKGGYIFSYKDEKLSLVKAVNLDSVKRAVYLDDYLYIISSEKIVVLDEKNWGSVSELNLL